MNVFANVKDAAEALYGARCEAAEEPAVVIDLDDTTSVTVFSRSPDDGEVFVRARVGSLEGLANPGDLCEAALQGNLFWQGTDGATLSLNHDEMALYLTDRRPADTLADAESLGDFLQDFTSTLGVWRNRLELSGKEAL